MVGGMGLHFWGSRKSPFLRNFLDFLRDSDSEKKYSWNPGKNGQSIRHHSIPPLKCWPRKLWPARQSPFLRNFLDFLRDLDSEKKILLEPWKKWPVHTPPLHTPTQVLAEETLASTKIALSAEYFSLFCEIRTLKKKCSWNSEKTASPYATTPYPPFKCWPRKLWPASTRKFWPASKRILNSQKPGGGGKHGSIWQNCVLNPVLKGFWTLYLSKAL